MASLAFAECLNYPGQIPLAVADGDYASHVWRASPVNPGRSEWIHSANVGRRRQRKDGIQNPPWPMAIQENAIWLMQRPFDIPKSHARDLGPVPLDLHFGVYRRYRHIFKVIRRTLGTPRESVTASRRVAPHAIA